MTVAGVTVTPEVRWADATVAGAAEVPMHAEATGDPEVVRWVVPPGVLPLDGAVTALPGALGRMLEDGTLADVRVEQGALLVRSGGPSWRTLGGAVRSALRSALAEPGGWEVGAGTTQQVTARPGTAQAGTAHDDDAPAPAEALRTAVHDVLAGPTGDFIRSHGGQVEVVAVADRCVDVRLSGACAHCPAAFFTLHGRLEQDLRARYPELVELRAVGSVPSVPSWLRRPSTVRS